MKQTLIIKDFDELVAVFPHMSLHQIISLYQSVLGTINTIESRIANEPNKDHSAMVERLQDAVKTEAFLSSYLARYCCKLCGF